MDIFEHFFIQKYNHEHKLFQEQPPGNNNPLFSLPHNAQFCHTTA